EGHGPEVRLLLPLREGEPGGHPPDQVDDRLRRAGRPRGRLGPDRPRRGARGRAARRRVRTGRRSQGLRHLPALVPRGHGAHRPEDRPGRRPLSPDATGGAGVLMSDRRPRVRTWRRTLRALALDGRARAARSGTGETDGVLRLSPGPHATALAPDRGPLAPPVLR